jgi:NAD(P)-dependent dehydrogenase (short-subunit alcohol dehydrogenase family)
MAQLNGQVAIITGGGTGIGAATARALAAEGARVVLAGRRAGPLAEAASAIAQAGGTALEVTADVTQETQVAALVERAVAAFGRVDVLVHAAGRSVWLNMPEMTSQVWDSTLGVNLRAAYLLARAAWPHMLKQRSGLIITIGSVAAMEAYAGQAAYCASKFGLLGLTQVLALEGREHNIRACAVCPAATETPLWQGWAPPEAMRRMMRPEDVAEAIRWLAVQPQRLTFEPLVIRNLRDPWAE